MRKMLWGVALLLTGCASVTDLRGGTPIASWDSAKPAQAVAECIRDSWQNQRIGLEANGATLQTTGNLFTVVSPPGGVPAEVADIQTAGSGSKVAIYAQGSLDLGGRKSKRMDAAHKCI